MAKTATYSLIQSQTLGSNQSSVTFSSIPQTFTDLVLVTSIQTTVSEDALRAQFNSDTSTNYSMTQVFASTAAASNRQSSATGVRMSNGSPNSGSQFAIAINHIIDYSNSTTYKSILSRATSTYISAAFTGLWRSTAAITSIVLYPENGGNIFTGSTFKLYGIEAYK